MTATLNTQEMAAMDTLYRNLRAKLADQAVKRDALVARSEQVAYWTMPNYATAIDAPRYWQPGDYSTSTLDYAVSTGARAYAGRINLAARRNRNAKVAHGWNAATDLRPLDVGTLAAIAAIDREHRLTRDSRNLIRVVRNHVTRDAVIAQGDTHPLGTTWTPADDRVDALAAIDAKTPGSNRAWKGIIPTTETRVNVRGAYGKRGVKVTPGTQVSTRDHRVPTWALRDLKTVGLATVPGVTEWGAEHVTELMEWVRRDRKRATVRVYLPTYDVTSRALVLVDTVVHADDYAPADGSMDRAERTQSHAVRAGIAQVEQDMSRQRASMAALAERGVIGYLGDANH